MNSFKSTLNTLQFECNPNFVAQTLKHLLKDISMRKSVIFRVFAFRLKKFYVFYVCILFIYVFYVFYVYQKIVLKIYGNRTKKKEQKNIVPLHE